MRDGRQEREGKVLKTGWFVVVVVVLGEGGSAKDGRRVRWNERIGSGNVK